jgi:DNA invertase Pin-like site-specific DNA recombinase
MRYGSAMQVGYARVSTIEQDEERQIARLLELGVPQNRIYTDKGWSGKTMTRTGLEKALEAVRDGDTFIVPSLDRLARNTEGALEVIRKLTDAGVVFQNGVTTYDPTDPMAKLFLTILAAVAEAEGGWISLRTREAMAQPKVRKKLKGRRSNLTEKQDASIAAHMAAGDLPVAEIAHLFNTSRTGAYRAAARHAAREAAKGTG